MNTKTYYLFDPVSGAFIEPYEAQESPLEPGTYIAPTHSLEVAPPAVSAGQIAVVAGGAWTIAEDHRGATIYDQATGTPQEVSTIGPIPTGWALTPPPPTLSQAQAAQIASLTASCASTITGGFSSSALGAPYTYPTKQTDQQNLAASVLASLLPSGQAAGWTTPFWCSDTNNVWDFRPHTATQIQQVGDEAKAFITTQQARLKTLTDQVNTAATVAAVQAIVW